MKRLRTTSAALALALLPTLPGCAADSAEGAKGEESSVAFNWTFEDGGRETPEGWRVGSTNLQEGEREARWELGRDSARPAGSGVLSLVDSAQHSGATYNLCWRPEVSLRDLELEVSVRAHLGEEDQGGGPAWRIAGADDYYVARWNPLEDNFRVYVVVDGRRVQLDSADVEAEPGAWHRIRVRHQGDRITCWLDGVQLLEAVDDRHAGEGGVGVWTKADAATAFDDLELRPLP